MNSGCLDQIQWDLDGINPPPSFPPMCQALKDAKDALWEAYWDLYDQRDAKELALQQLLGLLAVYC